MGRTKKDDSSSSATKAVDAKSKAIEKAKQRQTRERAQKSYREHSESEESEKEVAFKDEEVKFSDEEMSASESGSDWAGESSGSEYGKKKSKGKKGKAVARGRGRKPAASPKGKGRGRPPAKGKAKAKASPASSRNGNRKAAAKRYRDDSESESEAASSGSEYGKRAKPTPKKSPSKPAPAPSSRGRGRPKAAAKSYKEISEDDFSEEEAPKKSAPKKFKKDESEEERNKSDESGSEKSENESKPAKATPKPKPRATASKPAKNGEDEEDGLDEEKPADKKKPKESDESGSAGSESEEEKPKEKPKEKPAPKSEAKNGDKDDKAKKEDDDEEDEDDISEEEEPEKKSEPAAAPLKNKTDTDFDSIDFECTKKSSKGDAWNFKISCWNIGGIKSWIKKNGLDYLKHENPDVMCLQEIKCSDKTKPPEVKSISGYPFTYWEYAEQSGHHGVAILSKTEPKKVTNGLPIEDSDSDEEKKAKEKFNVEGRLLTAEYEHFHLVNAYVPNGGRGVPSEKHPKGYPPKVANGERQEFDKLLRVYVKSLDEKKPVILTGDLNVSHAEIDLANPKTNNATAGFTKEEREGMTQLLEETKLFDSFRELYPDKKAAYTFWSYMHNSRQKNIGWRLDYFLLSEKLKESLCENLMRTEVYGSDHCPLVLFIKV